MLLMHHASWPEHASGPIHPWFLYIIMQAANLDSAVTAALLLLPAAFTSVDLFSVICGLSYMADIRMAFAEDSRKVGTIMLESQQALQCVCRS